jgi:hypothetical protein
MSNARYQLQELPWEYLERISPKTQVVTGDEVTEEAPAALPTAAAERTDHPLLGTPIAILIHTDPDTCDGKCRGACGRYLDLEEQVLGNEKVLLALQAFRRIRMNPEDAATEPLLEGHGDALPRIVLIDVARDDAVVLSGSGVSATKVYKQLKTMADGFFEVRLDNVVKKHLKLLAAHDKLAVEEQRLTEQLSRVTNDRKLEKLEDEKDDLEDAQRDLDKEIEGLWRLTLREL